MKPPAAEVRRRTTIRALIWAFVVAGTLSACIDPAAEKAARERDDARLRVLADAMFYWRCVHQPVVVAAECDGWREAYERNYAAFIARYAGQPSR